MLAGQQIEGLLFKSRDQLLDGDGVRVPLHVQGVKLLLIVTVNMICRTDMEADLLHCLASDKLSQLGE